MNLVEVARLVRVRAASPPRARREVARRGELMLLLELNGFCGEEEIGRMGSFSDMAKEKQGSEASAWRRAVTKKGRKEGAQ